jgi:hypothetical protein
MLKYERCLKAIAVGYVEELNKSQSSVNITRLKGVGIALFDTVGRVACLALAPFEHLEQSLINLFDNKISTSITHLSNAFSVCFVFFGNILFMPIKLPYLLYKNIKDPKMAHPIELDTKNMHRTIAVLGSGPQFDKAMDQVSAYLY